jgi:integrase/recombinase XerD
MDMKLYYEKRSHTWGIRLSRSEFPPSGKFVRLSKIVGRAVTTEEEARRVFDIYQEERLKEKLIELQRGKTCTLEQLKRLFPADRPGLSGDTLRMDRLALQHLITAAGAAKQVWAVTKADLQKMANSCLARGLSVASVEAYLRHIKAALNWAIDAGYREKLPKFPTLPRRKRLPRAIPIDHLTAILQWAQDHDRRLWRMALFAAYTGCRRSEVLRVRGMDVQLYPCPQLPVVGRVRIVGKGDAERFVPLLIDALPALDPLPQLGRIFPKINKDTLSHWFSAAVAGSGFVDARGSTLYNFHSLRHTFGTLLVRRGVHLRVVQQILGHSDSRVTEIYSELAGNAVEAELGRAW